MKKAIKYKIMSHNESASGVESCQFAGKCDLINVVSGNIFVARKKQFKKELNLISIRHSTKEKDIKRVSAFCIISK